MLSDAEQRRLTEIEWALWVQDRAFVRGFERDTPGGKHRRRGVACTVLLLTFCVTVAGLFAGPAVALVVGLLAAVAGAGIWAVTGAFTQLRGPG